MIVLGVEITNANKFRGLGVRFARLRKDSLRDVAEFWHGRSFDRHFTPGNETRYQMARRKDFYLQKIKPKVGQGQGKFVDLLLRGKSQRWMRSFKTVSGTSTAATLRMRPPGYFTNPFKGTYRDKKGRMRRITRQPDKPAEVTRVDDADRRSMAWYLKQRLQSRFEGIMFAGSGI